MGSCAENRLFFIYDKSELDDQDADIQECILYCHPNLTPESKMNMLIGQVVGVLEWVEMFSGSPATTIRLKHSTIAVKHAEHYILCYSGEGHMSESQLCQVLDNLYELFCFFHGSLVKFCAVCRHNQTCLKTEFQAAFDCYLSYVRRFGDDLRSSFQSIPMQLPLQEENYVHKACSDLLVMAKDLVPGSRAGCILNKERVLLTDLPPSLTLQLCIFKPRQHHLSSCHVEDVEHLPEGVRLLSVYVSDEEFALLSSPHTSKSSGSGSTLASANPLGQGRPFTERNSVDGVKSFGHSSSYNNGDPTRHSRSDKASPELERRPASEETGATRMPASPTCRQPVCKSLARCAIKNRKQMELYVMGHSCSVFLLFTDPGCIRNVDLRLKLWVKVQQKLSDLERRLLQVYDANSRQTADHLPFVLFNNHTKQLSGNALSPITSSEHVFCDCCLKMHNSLRQTPEMTSMSMSCQDTVFCAHRRDSRELFYRCRRQDLRRNSHSVLLVRDDMSPERLVDQLLSET